MDFHRAFESFFALIGCVVLFLFLAQIVAWAAVAWCVFAR